SGAIPRPRPIPFLSLSDAPNANPPSLTMCCSPDDGPNSDWLVVMFSLASKRVLVIQLQSAGLISLTVRGSVRATAAFDTPSVRGLTPETGSPKPIKLYDDPCACTLTPKITPSSM